MIECPTTIEELQAILEAHRIPLESWGKGKAKTLRHLLEELRNGEAILTETPEGGLIREVSVACLEITRGDMVLEELFQLFYEDGRKRQRTLDTTTGEKLKPGETPEDGILRLIETEFPVLRLQPPDSIRRMEDRFRESTSESYPGLMTRYRLHFFSVELSIELPPIMVQEADKLSAYHWVRRE